MNQNYLNWLDKFVKQVKPINILVNLIAQKVIQPTEVHATACTGSYTTQTCWGLCWLHSDPTPCGQTQCKPEPDSLRWHICQQFERRIYADQSRQTIFVGNKTMCGWPTDHCMNDNCSAHPCIVA